MDNSGRYIIEDYDYKIFGWAKGAILGGILVAYELFVGVISIICHIQYIYIMLTSQRLSHEFALAKTKPPLKSFHQLSSYQTSSSISKR